tara:strand:+ start:166 stop:546 length:381 start_codon:yes stop_codon:yes gene_type:complete
MAHFAKIEDGVVTKVIVADQDVVDTYEGTWIQTSYNTRGNVHYEPNSNTPDEGEALRGNYAGIGYTYDSTNDVFYGPKPYSSWVLGTNSWLWNPPITRPSDSGEVLYKWNEDLYQSDNTKGWVEND